MNKNLISKIFTRRLLNKSRRVMAVISASIFMVCTLAGCGSQAAAKSSEGGKADAKDGADKKISVVTTIFPEYDWVKEVVGDNENVELTMLLDNGVDLHSYQPTAEDIMKIGTCDLFIYVGGESDEWVDDALKEAVNKDMKVINLLDTLGSSVKEEEVKEGMQAEDEHDHEDGDEEHEDADEKDHEDADEDEHDNHDEDAEAEEHGHDHEEGEVEYDEHVWLSLKNSQVLVSAIADSLAEIDTVNADTYKNNAEAYNKKLADLDAKYEDVVANAKNKTLLFGDRFPFRYLVDDYGLDYYAAFVGCSAETEASFETVSFLVDKVDELGLKAVLTIENSDQKIAKTIIDNSKDKDAVVLIMDSMQSTTSDDVTAGETYLTIMENNLKVLEDALN